MGRKWLANTAGDGDDFNRIPVYQLLANAVVQQAAEDYRKGLKKRYKLEAKMKKLKAQLKAATDNVDEIESFFTGAWIQILSKVDGKYVMENLKKEVEKEIADGKKIERTARRKRKEAKRAGA